MERPGSAVHAAGGSNGDRARGFALSVWLDGAGTSPEALAAALTDLVARVAPDAEVLVEPATGPGRGGGVVIDVGRQLLLVDGRPVQLNYREFRLLCYLVLRPGVTVGRGELIDAQRRWSRVTSPRTIDVHLQRLRVKLGAYGTILRTDRGTGYRYDAHADVRIRP